MHSSSFGRAALAVALVAAALPGRAAGHSVGANLRVEATNGKVLADATQYSSAANVRTSRGADCFGPPGGSGRRVKVPNATALGLVADALPNLATLRPLSLTDQFSFGLGVCGIGGHVASGQAFWYLKRNHVGAQVGGDQLKVHDGDRVLWYLAPSFPPGDELALHMPRVVSAGQPQRVRVTAFDDKGRETPAAGADVSFGTGPTDASGHTGVILPRAGTFRVQATKAGDIPSNAKVVCAVNGTGQCGVARRIFGSPGPDRISTTSGNDVVKAGAGDDRIQLKLGGEDRVHCGRGRDIVVRHHQDRDDRIAASCEKVIRR